jgi:hypothetical protein
MNKVNPEAWLAWRLERIQDHPANRINDLMPWAYQDIINAKNAEAEAKDAARSTVVIKIWLILRGCRMMQSSDLGWHRYRQHWRFEGGRNHDRGTQQ